MIWASRRQLLGWLLKERPAAWVDATTSHRRKSTLRLPPALLIWPTTRPDAPTWRQSGKRGAALALMLRSMKEPGGIDRNRPELCRSLRMTVAISAPTASPPKSAMAIGIGSKLGLVMSMVSCACAGIASAAKAAAHRAVRRCRGIIIWNLFLLVGGLSLIARPFSIVAGVEIEGDNAPGIVFFR